MTAVAPRPLQGARVLDVSAGVSGSFAAKVLADYGASVVKVEPADGRGLERTLGPFPEELVDAEHSGMFLYLNANKRGVALDLEHEHGRGILSDLAATAEIVILGDRFREVSDLLGDVPALRNAVGDGRIVTAVTPYGLDGPYRERAAEEINLFGFGGPMWATGAPGREPMMYPEYVALLQAGAAAALATLIAYYGKVLSGVGACIDFAIAETLLGSWDRRAYSLQAYQYTGDVPAGRVPTHALAFGTYPCKDGFVTLAAQGARFPKVLALIGREDLLDDPRFAGFSASFDPANFAFFDELLLGWLAERTRREVFITGQEYGVLVAPLLTAGETLDDPHLAARGFWQDIEDGRSSYRIPGRPVVLHGDSRPPIRRAPHLGEHTDEVLSELLGYTRETLDSLRAQAVL